MKKELHLLPIIERKMMPKELSEETEQGNPADARNVRKTAIRNAVLIGFLAGVIIYGVVINKMGFLVVIPLLLIFIFINGSRRFKGPGDGVR